MSEEFEERVDIKRKLFAYLFFLAEMQNEIQSILDILQMLNQLNLDY